MKARHTTPSSASPWACPALVALAVFFYFLAASEKVAAQPARPVPSPRPSPSASPGVYVPNIENVVLPPPVTLPPPTEVPADVPNRPLTADEAARIALFHQPNVTVARSGVVAAQGRTQQARSGLLPNVTLQGSYTSTSIATSVGGSSSSSTPGATTAISQAAATGAAIATSQGGGGSTPGYQVSANLRQLLWDFNHTRDTVMGLAELERVALANLTRTQADLVLQVKQAFFTLAQNDRLVSVNETNVRNQQEHLALAQARFRAGLGLPADVVRAQTAVASAVFDLTQARVNSSLSRVSLATLMGIDPRTPFVPAASPQAAITPADPQQLFDIALRQRPEMVQAEAQVRSNQWAVRAAYSTNAPSVSGVMGWTGRGNSFPPTDTEIFNAGVVLQWSVFDGGLTAGRVREARANWEAAVAQLQGTRLTIISDVAQAWLNLRTAEQRIVTSRSEVANAQESLRLNTGRYRAGLGTFLDVLDAENALVTAESNAVSAQSAVDQARAALARAVGAGLPPGIPTVRGQPPSGVPVLPVPAPGTPPPMVPGTELPAPQPGVAPPASPPAPQPGVAPPASPPAPQPGPASPASPPAPRPGPARPAPSGAPPGPTPPPRG